MPQAIGDQRVEAVIRSTFQLVLDTFLAGAPLFPYQGRFFQASFRNSLGDKEYSVLSTTHAGKQVRYLAYG